MSGRMLPIRFSWAFAITAAASCVLGPGANLGRVPANLHEADVPCSRGAKQKRSESGCRFQTQQPSTIRSWLRSSSTRPCSGGALPPTMSKVFASSRGKAGTAYCRAKRTPESFTSPCHDLPCPPCQPGVKFRLPCFREERLGRANVAYQSDPFRRLLPGGRSQHTVEPCRLLLPLRILTGNPRSR